MIRESLNVWRHATESLLRILDVRDEEKRDGVIEQVEKLIGDRDELQPSIQAPFTNDELAFGQALVPLEKELQTKLAIFTKDIRLDITEQQKKKDSSNAYTDPYSQVFRDGTFYDKKK
ncbi:MAG: hypothetical protein ACE3JQ_12800 [Paenisporosarcina sp.]